MFATLTTRPRLFTATVTTALLALLTGHPTLARSIGADVWNVPTLNEQLREATGANEQLDAEDDQVRHRIALKELIIGELLAGRATLAEATARFDEMNATRPGYMESIRASHPGVADREIVARNVISYTLSRASAETHRALSQRLEAELQQMLTERAAP